MPMIQVKVTTPLTAEQDVKIHDELTKAVVEVFRKPIDYVMVNVEPDSDLWIEGVHVYTTFQTINQWGWDGKIL